MTEKRRRKEKNELIENAWQKGPKETLGTEEADLASVPAEQGDMADTRQWLVSVQKA